MTQWKDKSRKHWRYQFKANGQRYGGRGFATRDEARNAEVDHRQRLKEQAQDESLIQTTDHLDFRSVAYEYLHSSKRKFAKKTHNFKVMVCKNFHVSLPKGLLLSEITTRHVEHYLKARPSNNNWNAHRKDLHTVFAFAIKRKYIDHNPVSDVDTMPHTPAVKPVPTPEQVAQLIDACEPVHERPLFLSILHTLGRVDELLRLKWHDVDFERRQLVLWTRKRKGGAYEPDAMPMNNVLHEVLKALYEDRRQDEWVFLNPLTGTRYNRRPKFMRGLCKRAFDPACKRIEDYAGPVFGFHALRHFMASFLAAQGKGSLKDFQRILRHKEARTTEIYLHQLSDNLRELVSDAEVFKVGVPLGVPLTEKDPK